MSRDNTREQEEPKKLNKPKCLEFDVLFVIWCFWWYILIFWIVNRVKDLNPNHLKIGFNLVVKAVEEPDLKISRLYLDGTTLKVASVLVGDDTGCVSLHLKDEQISGIKKDTVLILRNCTIQMSKARMYIKVDQWGVIEKCPSDMYTETIDKTNNVSAIEWELVPPNQNQN